MYYRLTASEITDPDDLIKEFGILRRMLERNLMDLRDSRLINVRYDRLNNVYENAGDAVFNETAKDRRRQHRIIHDHLIIPMRQVTLYSLP